MGAPAVRARTDPTSEYSPTQQIRTTARATNSPPWTWIHTTSSSNAPGLWSGPGRSRVSTPKPQAGTDSDPVRCSRWRISTCSMATAMLSRGRASRALDEGLDEPKDLRGQQLAPGHVEVDP